MTTNNISNQTPNDILFNNAKEVLVGGVNSPVRAFDAVGGSPVFMKSGQGAILKSESGKSYIDYVLAYGPHLLGHAPTDVVRALTKTLSNGMSFGSPTVLETQLATQIRTFYPMMEKIRMVNSGTEATMSAIRLARGITKRKYIVKFNGCYHGHADSLLVAAGSGSLTLGKPSSAGVLPEFVTSTLVVDFNDTEAITALFKDKGKDIAGVIVEPVCGNMGVIRPHPTYLETIRSLCDTHGSLLIFDEVMCGFRIAPGGANAYFGVEPDLVCLGKIIGGGLPCGAYGGKTSVMSHLSPLGDVYQAGTLSGNALVMKAGLVVLSLIKETNAITKASQLTSDLSNKLQEIILHYKIPASVTVCGSMFSVFFTQQPVHNLADVKTCDVAKFKSYYHAMLDAGIYLAPSQFEANFLSTAHTEAQLETTADAFEDAVS